CPALLYTSSLHDALPISYSDNCGYAHPLLAESDPEQTKPSRVLYPIVLSDGQFYELLFPCHDLFCGNCYIAHPGQSKGIPPCGQDRKSTRLNSSHVSISY